MGRREWGRIRKLPSGKWQARYPGPDGVLRPADRTFDTKGDAAAWLADKQSEINRDDWLDPDAGKVTLADFGTKWIAERKLEETTRERYEIAFRVHVVPHLGEVELAKLKEGRIRTWRKTLEDDGVGKAAMAKAYRVLRAILNTAVDDRLIRRNPCRIKKADEDGSAERDAPTLNEVFALADAVPPRFRALVLLGAFTSLRFGELAALTRTSVDLAEGEIHVRKSQAELRGGRRVVKAPKSAAGVRIVAIPKVILDDVRTHVERFSEQGADGRVFVGPLGGKLSRHNFRKVWVKAVADSKIKKSDVHFHDLRHTGNDLAAKAGATTRELMARMGHSSVRAALIYQHASREADRKIADSMSKAVRKAKKAARPKGHAKGTTGDLAS